MLPNLPGWTATVLMIFFTTLWTFWGTAEMYHEGWWGAWYNRLPYLAPIVITLIPTLVAFRWPVIGGIDIVVIGIFALFFFGSGVAIIGLAIALVGTAFVIDGVIKHRTTTPAAEIKWWLRYWRYLVVTGVVMIVIISVSAFNLPVVLTRQDDGNRSARLIKGNNVALIWSPKGPGWNWKQPWGGYPSWQSIAVYGVSPVGLEDKPGYGKQDNDYKNIRFATSEDMSLFNLCLYLSADGLTLAGEPQNIWRMPTTNEIIRSLGRHGENSGCEWLGEFRQQVQCDVLPDKESPLWSTDVPVIYYWTADERIEEQGYFVAYNGMVNAAYKLGGNPRHGYRCVKEP